ncbi:amylopullulanase [Bacillus timonensis]|nr:amylopullulanase [Bacillus timonensis]
MKRKHLKSLSLLMIFTLIMQMFAGSVPFANAETDEGRNVVVTGNFQSKVGGTDWDPGSTVTKMKYVGNGFYEYTATLPQGDYEYKIAIGSWDESYGRDGGNIPLSLASETEVTFYYNDYTNQVADSTHYTPIVAEKQPRLVGSLQEVMKNGGNWNPKESTALLVDDRFDHVYTYTAEVPAGDYEFKIVLGNDWGEEYPSSNATLSLAEQAIVTFFFNANTKEVTTDVTKEEKPTEGRNVILVGSLQDELGHDKEWDPAAATTKMTHVGDNLYTFTGTLPAGSYEYKVAIGSWDENYGAGGAKSGDNIKLTLEQETEVTFYYHDETHRMADSTHYWMIAAEKMPRIVGDIQPDINAGSEWAPSESTAFLTDYDFDHVYKFTSVIPKGNHKFKVVLGNSWNGTEAYPGEDFVLNVMEDAEITISFNDKTKEVLTDYNPNGSDGLVSKDKLFHDTWHEAYRQPFGAIAAGEKVTLRLAAKKDDLSRASVYVKNYLTGDSKMLKMKYAGWTEVEGKGQVEFWETTFTSTAKGVHGYKFIVGDGDSVAEYGEDSTEGGVGSASDRNAGLFQLTVFDPTFTTPDWMKEAVVYQIFPDRFFNGNAENDDNKEYARGYQPIEKPSSWSALPDNPRIKEKKPEQYTGDGEWSNDFFGGDIAGVHQKLDYLQSLGVNTIYLNPIAYAASNHKYDATDFKAIDPMFGTPEEFDAFTKELQKRDMHLILDGVFNHVADDSIYFDRYGKYDTVGAYEYWAAIYDLMNNEGLTEAKAIEQVEAKFKAEGQLFSSYGFHNWFNIENKKVDVGTPYERYSYQAWWGFDSLPEIKSIEGDIVDYGSELNNQRFADYIMYEEDSVAKSWLTRGGSGWRLDVANEVDMEFWREFRKELKGNGYDNGATLNDGDEPLILGEIWDDASKYFLGDQYDSVMNYRFERAIMSYLKNGNATQAEQQLKAVQEDYPNEAFYALMNLMGSHDTPRAVYLLGNGSDSYDRAEWDPNYNHALGVKRLKLASIIQMGYAGAPTIYYGDEAGVTGSKDPDDRRTYPWGNEDQDLINHYKKIGKIREDNAKLFAYGELTHAYAKDDVLAYVRTNTEKAAIVAINRGNESKTFTVNVKDLVANGVTLTDALQTSYTTVTANGTVEMTVPAMSGRMLISETLSAAPNAVTSLAVTEGSKSVSLTWEGNASEYVIYQSNIKGALFKQIGTTSDKTFTVNDLQNGRTYFYAVTAVDNNGNESVKTISEAVIPHYDLSSAWIGNLTQLEESSLDLSKTYTVQAELWVSGATEVSQAEGVMAKLEVRKVGENAWVTNDAVYTGQAGNNNVFAGSFIPFTTGTYEYRIGISSDLGREWKYTEVKTVTLTQDTNDTTAPAEKVILAQPIQESGQVNLSWELVNADEPYLITIIRDGALLDILTDVSKTTYRDYQVENGKTYEYQVVVYDKAGNKVESNTVTVTPDIVMVEVTFKVNAPSYTPLTANVTMPNSLNGWNTGAWQMSRNGAVTADWEYTVEVQEGTEITYKYVKGGSWDQEGLPDHTRNDRSDDDVSYYGYGAIGTDLKVVVQNQGNNKMVVQDYLLRWIDMPLVVSSPENNATVNADQKTIEIKGNAIKGGVLTIAGEQVVINDDMTFSHTVSLVEGQNDIELTIEPSEESKQNIFQNDGGAIGKNTKAYKLTVYRGEKPGGEEPGDGETPEEPGDGGEEPGEDKGEKLKEKETKPKVKKGKVTIDTAVIEELQDQGILTVNLEKEKIFAIELTEEQVALLKEKSITIKIANEDMFLFVPVSNLPNGAVTLNIERMKDVKNASSAVYDFTVKAGNTTYHHFNAPMTIVLKVENVKSAEDVKVYYYNEEKKKWELVGGTYEDGYVTVETNHFSTFAAFELAPSEEPSEIPAPKAGYKMPKTATSMFHALFVGMLLLATGGALFIVQRRRRVEA